VISEDGMSVGFLISILFRAPLLLILLLRHRISGTTLR
jgi:hypothetical protein